MARFEPSTLWQTGNTSTIEGMRINGVVNVPESVVAPPTCLQTPSSALENHSPSTYFHYPVPSHTEVLASPTESLDSAFVSRPTSCNSHPISHKHLVYGAPDFSVTALDSSTGASERLSIPAPRVRESKDATSESFSQGDVLTMTTVGEAQVWAGTTNCTLHVFDLTPELRLSNHAYTTLTDPVLHIAARTGGGRIDSKVDLLLGSPSGYITVMSGKVDECGGLRNGLRVMRKVVQIGESKQAVKCIIHVNCAGVETYWCGCGSDIVIVSRLTWRVAFTIDKRLHNLMPHRLPKPRKPCQVTQLLSTEQGVWSCLSDTSTVCLWDTLDYTLKKRIKCRSFAPTNGILDFSVQITALAYSYPLLFVGTDHGHVSVFRTADDPSTGRMRCPSLPVIENETFSLPLILSVTPTRLRASTGYKLLCATHCGPFSVVGIYVTPTGSMDLRHSPFWSPVSSPSLSAATITVVCTPKAASENSVSVSHVKLYELVSTPTQSPNSTPETSICPSPQPILNIVSPSKLDSEPPNSLPPLSIVSAAPTSLTLLTLDEKTH